MLLAYPFDARAQSRQMTMVHSWEQVMLNLVIQTATEVVAKEAAIAEVLRRDNLVFVEIWTRCVCASLRQMIYLSVEHETHA